VLKGSIDTTQSSNSFMDAAHKLYERISGWFNHVPKFSFTVQQIGSGKMSDFHVVETKNGSEVSYKIEQSANRLSDEGKKDLLKTVDNINEEKNYPGKSELSTEMLGGKRKKKHKKYYDNSSSSSDESPIFNYKKNKNYGSIPVEPIYYYWYDPSMYAYTEYYQPTFVSPLKPYVVLTYGYGNKIDYQYQII
jgi:hypothetical protein